MYIMLSRILKILSITLGLFMITIGLNKFIVFTEIPAPPGDGGTLMSIYISSGFLKLVGVLEILGGLGLVFNRMKGLSLILISAIMFNASVFHLLHEPKGIAPALVCFALALGLSLMEKDFRERFK